ncbi:hypothetical protein AB2Z22_003128 [Clostridium botulinum]
MNFSKNLDDIVSYQYYIIDNTDMNLFYYFVFKSIVEYYLMAIKNNIF